MAVAALMLSATQVGLAWWIARHSTIRHSVLTQAIVAGLMLTFLLATASSFLLGGQQPPAGVGHPIVDWHSGGTDARPAHLMGGPCAAVGALGGLGTAAGAAIPPGRVADRRGVGLRAAVGATCGKRSAIARPDPNLSSHGCRREHDLLWPGVVRTYGVSLCGAHDGLKQLLVSDLHCTEGTSMT